MKWKYSTQWISFILLQMCSICSFVHAAFKTLLFCYFCAIRCKSQKLQLLGLLELSPLQLLLLLLLLLLGSSSSSCCCCCSTRAIFGGNVEFKYRRVVRICVWMLRKNVKSFFIIGYMHKTYIWKPTAVVLSLYKKAYFSKYRVIGARLHRNDIVASKFGVR